MLNSKEFLIFLVSILLFINVFLPLKRINELKHKKLNLYENKISLEKGFLKNSKRINNIFKNIKNIIKKNNNYLYSYKTKNSQIFNLIQSKINKIAKENDADVKNIIWGEPYIINKKLVLLPLDIIITIYPNNLEKFFNKLFSLRKIFSIKQLNLTKNSKNITINMRIILFKVKS